jgi:O-antigen/teichoic acid export membrane protein/O-antigen ligase
MSGVAGLAPGTVTDSTIEMPAVPARKPFRVHRRADVVRVVMIAAIWALPLLRPAGPGNTGPVDLVLSLAVIAAMLWLSGRRAVIRLPFAIPVGVSILAGTLASLVAYSHAYVSVGGGLLAVTQDAFILAWALAVANLGRDTGMLQSMTRAWAISATVWSALMILGVLGHVSALSGETVRTGSRAAFTLGDPNLAADYFLVSLFVLRAARYPGRTVLRWACAAVIVAGIIFTGSNGGMLALLFATLAGAVFGLARRRGAAAAVAATAVIVLGGVAAVSVLHVQTIVEQSQASGSLLSNSVGRQAESSGSRGTILAETEQLYFTGDNLLGIGPQGTKLAFQAHLYSYVKEAHDDYTAALIERGLLGALALVTLLVMVLVRCRRIASRPLRPEFAEIIPRPELLGAAVLAVLLSAMFYQVLHFRHVWALFGLVAALDLWGRADRDGRRPLLQRPRPGPRARELAAKVRPGPGGDVTGADGSGADGSGADGDGTGAEGDGASAGRKGPLGKIPGVLTANVAARLVALGALTLATILVAHEGGPALLGELALLRVLPGLAGVLVSCGLPTAVPYFLAGRDHGPGPRLRPTLITLTLAGSLAACACWLALTPLLNRVFFHSWGPGVAIAAAVPVFTQLWVAVGKSLLQGENDMRGANWAIAFEETMFLPVYLAMLPVLAGSTLLIVSLVGADVLVVAGIGIRLARRGFFRHWGRPSRATAFAVCRYGLRGQVGGVFTLLNLRLDVAILGAIAGPAVLGVYAVASKYAELLRLPGLAVTYVLYPRLAVRTPADAAKRVAELLPRAVGFTVLAAVPLAAAVPLLPVIYGHAFSGAEIPALLLLVGLLGEGAAGLVSAYLYGVGRPGANSFALGVAVVVTVALDVTLIRHYQAIGAGFASMAAYLTSTGVLLACYFAIRRIHPAKHRPTVTVRAS